MKMLKVNNFLGCMTLETGGLVIGWFNAICDVFSILAGASIVFIFSLWDCDDLKDVVDEDDEPILNDYEKEMCSFSLAMVIGVGILLIILGIAFMIIACFCIKGTYRRNHSHVKPMTVLMGIATVLAFIRTLSSVAAILPGLVKVLLYGYQFIVMYSLYSKFQDESDTRHTVQYHVPIEKV